jgi:hypothetical protein
MIIRLAVTTGMTLVKECCEFGINLICIHCSH